jgi:uncharacterized protein with NRDE domain
MCLIFFSINEHPKYKLIVAANRDEFYERPALPAHWWKKPQILAGKDLKGNGTWMAVNKNGKFAALTNYRDPASFDAQKESRGKIIVDYFLTEKENDFFESLKHARSKYNSYNFIGYQQGKISYYSNRLDEVTVLKKGNFALSNGLLDTAWPKVEKIKRDMAGLLKNHMVDTQAILELLSDTTLALDEQLPHTGVPLQKERMLSPVFIKSENYGTRCSSVLLIDQSGHIEFEERTYIPKKSVARFSF